MIIKIILIPKKIYFNVANLIIARKDTAIQAEHLLTVQTIVKPLRLIIIIQQRLLTMVMETNKVKLKTFLLHEKTDFIRQ